ncbi:hypothetical protein ACFOHS_04445 [Jhaorihella thermophila]
MIRAVLTLLVTALPAWAGDAGHFRCQGALPDWTLSLGGEKGPPGLRRPRHGDDGRCGHPRRGPRLPRAAALLAGPEDDHDTAIILLDTAECTAGGETWPMRGSLLTQIGNRAVLLAGCCQPAR